MLKEKGERTEPTNQPADHTRKVYCEECKHFYNGWMAGDPFIGCRKIVGYTDTPTCRRPEYLIYGESNESNDCPHYAPKRRGIWKKLFGSK